MNTSTHIRSAKVYGNSSDCGKLNHNDLVKVIAANPLNQKAWREFHKRYHHTIVAAILRIVNNSTSSYAEDIAQEVYKIIIKDNCQALKRFNGLHENSIFKWLKIIAVREAIKQVHRLPLCRHFDNIDILSKETYLHYWAQDQANFDELVETIEFYLDRILGKNPKAERNKLIFRMRFYARLNRGRNCRSI